MLKRRAMRCNVKSLSRWRRKKYKHLPKPRPPFSPLFFPKREPGPEVGGNHLPSLGIPDAIRPGRRTWRRPASGTAVPSPLIHGRWIWVVVVPWLGVAGGASARVEWYIHMPRLPLPRLGRTSAATSSPQTAEQSEQDETADGGWNADDEGLVVIDPWRDFTTDRAAWTDSLVKEKRRKS